MASKSMKVGIVGCGDICPNYLKHARLFPILEVAACADLVAEHAQKMVAEHGVPRACTIDELLADPTIELVVNLTNPMAHVEVSRQAIEAGKHVYSEKPLAIELDDAYALIETAKTHGVRLGCAPDTFLGGGLQTCLKLINDGVIGRPVAAAGFFMGHGPEDWHPSPEFFYKYGAGPMLDLGPYFMTTFTVFLGPTQRVTAIAGAASPQRTITSQPLYGTLIDVEVPTHFAGTMQLHSDAIASVIITWDVWASTLPHMEIYGTEGTLSVPDPNGFGGTPRLRLAGERQWRDVALTHPLGGRSFGVADMVQAIRSGRPHRANAEMALHLLEILHAFHTASDTGSAVELTTTCERPAPLPPGLAEGELDD